MKYGKAKGIVLLQKYLPQISPFKSIDIISTIEEWDSVKDKYGEFSIHRVDMPIGEPKRNAVAGTSGFSDSIPGLIKIVNEKSPHGGLFWSWLQKNLQYIDMKMRGVLMFYLIWVKV